ncbi:MAG: PA14 domain-containing protein, partial [Planctomycetes bacterium]|nr:PA14 domain-containing protein [Planctomycetota bacterium]
SPWKGDIWRFQVQPLTAYQPFPVDGMKYVDPDQNLSWQKGMGVLFHVIYFGESFEQVGTAPAGGYMSVDAAYEPGPLKLDQTYYWRVDEFTGPATNKGQVWSFTTRGAGGGVKAQYFQGKDLAGAPVLTQTEGAINHNWAGGEVAAGLSDGVSARWTANLEAPFTGAYKLTTTSDDGVRLWLDGRPIIDNWTDHGTTDNTAGVDLVAGQVYSIRMEWYDNTGGAVAQLSWESPSIPRQIIPQGWLQLPLRATSPTPRNGSPCAAQNAPLQWLAGDEATNHDVYFGTDAQAVANADTTTAGIYRQRLPAATRR